MTDRGALSRSEYHGEEKMVADPCLPLSRAYFQVSLQKWQLCVKGWS